MLNSSNSIKLYIFIQADVTQNAATVASIFTPLADMFGNNTTFTCPYINNLGYTPRVFNSFTECTREIARSRVYGGLHTSSSCYVAIPQGYAVAAHINALKFKRTKGQ